MALLAYPTVRQLTFLPAHDGSIFHIASCNVAVLEIVPGVAQSIIPSGKKAPPAEKFVETYMPPTKREKIEALGS